MDNSFAIFREKPLEYFTPAALSYSHFQEKSCEISAAVETVRKRSLANTVCPGIPAL